MKTQRAVDPYKSDYLFWDSVKDVLSLFIPLPNIDFNYIILSDCRPDNRNRIGVLYINANCSNDAKTLLASVIRWAADSPNCFLPVGNLLYRLDQNRFWGVNELCDFFMHISTINSDISGWTETLREQYIRARRITDYENANNDFNYPIQDATKYKDFKSLIEVLYYKMRAYVKRHYDSSKFGTDSETRATMQVRLINALWAYSNHTTSMALSMPPADLMHLKLVDDTLFFSDVNRAITKKEFDFNSASWHFSPLVKRTMISLLKNYQSFLYQHRNDYSFRDIIIDYKVVSGIVFDKSGEKTWLSYDKSADKFAVKVPENYSFFKTVSLSEHDYSLFHSSEAYNFASIQSLFLLTCGNTELLDELALISCYICCTEKRFDGAIVLPEQYKDFYVSALSCPSGLIPDLAYFSLQNTIDDLITRKINKEPIIICRDSGKRMSKDQKDRLSKVIRGATITAQDPILKRKKHKNNAQFFVLGNESTVKKLEANGVPCYTLRIRPTKEALHCSQIWLKLILPLWGLMLDNKVKVKKKNPSETVESFLIECCEKIDEKYIEARALYDAYQQYCEKHSKTDILLFKDFNHYLEKTHNLTRKQLHKSEHKSPTVFYGIRLLDDKQKKAAETDKGTDKNEQFSQFFVYAFQILVEVYSRFDQFPFENAFDNSTLSLIKALAEKQSKQLP